MTASRDQVELLSAYLRGHNQPCPACSYDLRDLVEDRCPECGARLRLQLAEVDPMRLPFFIGCMGFVAPAGSAATGLVGSIAMKFRHSLDWADLTQSLLVNGAVLIISLIALAIWISRSRQLARQTRRNQWMLATLPWLLTIFGLAVCLLLFF